MAGDAPRGYGLVACCVDAPEGGAALDEAARIAALGGGRLVLVHVAEPPGRFSGGRTAWSPPEDELAAAIAAEAPARLQGMAGEAGAAEAVVLQGSDPADEIIAWAREAQADLQSRNGLVECRDLSANGHCCAARRISRSSDGFLNVRHHLSERLARDVGRQADYPLHVVALDQSQ